MFINFGCFQGPYTTLHKGYLNGYLIHRKCLMLAVRLFVLPNFPGPTFIPCPISILEARVRVIKLSFCQNDPPMGESFWQKDNLITVILWYFGI